MRFHVAGVAQCPEIIPVEHQAFHLRLARGVLARRHVVHLGSGYGEAIELAVLAARVLRHITRAQTDPPSRMDQLPVCLALCHDRIVISPVSVEPARVYCGA